MNTYAAIFAGTFIISFSGAAMPGPMLAVVMRESARRGVVAGPLVVLGHSLLETVTVAAILLGLGRFMEKPLFFGLTGLIGGAILLLMGVGMIKDLPKLTLAIADDGSKGVHPVAGGVLTSLSNPFFPLWWATAGLALMARAGEAGLPGQAVFFTAHTLSDLTWYTGVSLMIHFGRNYLKDRRYRVMAGLLAAMLLCFGVYFMKEGFASLTS